MLHRHWKIVSLVLDDKLIRHGLPSAALSADLATEGAKQRVVVDQACRCVFADRRYQGFPHLRTKLINDLLNVYLSHVGILRLGGERAGFAEGGVHGEYKEMRPRSDAPEECDAGLVQRDPIPGV